MPFAIAPGNRTCASCVSGKLRTKNKTGGITSLRLGIPVSYWGARKLKNAPIHGQIMVNAVHQEVHSKRGGMVGKQAVDVEQEAMEAVFQ